jgi:hypothetical protein
MWRRRSSPESESWSDASRAVLHWLVSVAVWVLVNAAIAAGVMAGLFIMFANANFDGFFIEARHLAQHYLDAPAAARMDFERIVEVAFALVFTAICFLRLETLRQVRAAAKGSLRPDGNGSRPILLRIDERQGGHVAD